MTVEYDSQAGREMPADPREAHKLVTDDEDLHAGLIGLAGMVAGSRGVDDLLAQIARFAAHAIPGVDGAGVTLVHQSDGPLRIQTWGATADVVLEIDRIQYDLLDEGPCITCMQTRQPVVSGLLAHEERWPRFGPRVGPLGINSSLSLPLLLDDVLIGAINAYARMPDAFTEHSVELGTQFAGPAAVSVHNTQLLAAARTKADQLQTALTSRAVIDQAIGILRSRTGGSSDEAFGRLREISQAENVKLAVIAQRLVDEAVRRADARRAGH
jgi:GAF domain-containing protein